MVVNPLLLLMYACVVHMLLALVSLQGQGPDGCCVQHGRQGAVTRPGCLLCCQDGCVGLLCLTSNRAGRQVSRRLFGGGMWWGVGLPVRLEVALCVHKIELAPGHTCPVDYNQAQNPLSVTHLQLQMHACVPCSLPLLLQGHRSDDCVSWPSGTPSRAGQHTVTLWPQGPHPAA